MPTCCRHRFRSSTAKPCSIKSQAVWVQQHSAAGRNTRSSQKAWRGSTPPPARKGRRTSGSERSSGGRSPAAAPAETRPLSGASRSGNALCPARSHARSAAPNPKQTATLPACICIISTGHTAPHLRVRPQQRHQPLLCRPLHLRLRAQLREVELWDGEQLRRLQAHRKGRGGQEGQLCALLAAARVACSSHAAAVHVENAETGCAP